MFTFWQYLENLSGNVPNLMQFDKELGRPLSKSETEGICVGTQCKALQYLRSKGLPAYKTYIHAPSPVGDFPIMHHIAVTEDQQGNFYILDDPQSKFLNSDTSYDWIEMPQNKLPLPVRAHLMHYKNPIEAFQNSEKSSFKNGVWETAIGQNRVRYDPTSNKFWSRDIKIGDIWYKKNTFDPQFIPLTNQDLMQAYGMDQVDAQATIRRVLQGVLNGRQGTAVFKHKGFIDKGNRAFADKHYYDA